MLSNRQTSGLLPEGATYRNGTCMTAPECTQKGGSESSSCAGGYILILYENATIMKAIYIATNNLQIHNQCILYLNCFSDLEFVVYLWLLPAVAQLVQIVHT